MISDEPLFDNVHETCLMFFSLVRNDYEKMDCVERMIYRRKKIVPIGTMIQYIV